MRSKCFVFIICLVLFKVSHLWAEELEKEHLWKTRAEISYVKTSGNTDTQTFAGKLKTVKESPVNRFFFTGNFLYARNRERETSNKLSIDGRWERVFTKRFYGLLAVGYLRDRFSGYEYRIFGGPGIGYDFIKTEHHKLQGLLSLSYYHDQFSIGEKIRDDYFSGRAIGKYEWRIRENLKLKETLEYSISFKETDKYFIDSETAVEVKINRLFSIGISYVVNYQNQLPSPKLKHIDTTFLTTLIIDF
jgi:putative salt-induced outer membrane protein